MKDNKKKDLREIQKQLKEWKLKIDWIGEKEITDKTEVIILVHEGAVTDSLSFDVFAKKTLKKDKPRLYKWLKSFEEDYTINCEIAERFLRRHKEFEYIFSNDFEHTFLFNCVYLNILLKIASKFSTVLVIAEHEYIRKPPK